jgi:hypothetical protein
MKLGIIKCTCCDAVITLIEQTRDVLGALPARRGYLNRLCRLIRCCFDLFQLLPLSVQDIRETFRFSSLS